MPTFLAAGSIAYDILLSYNGSFVDGIDTSRLNDLSVGYVTEHLVRQYGGTAANIAWNLKLLQQEAIIAGSVGNDGDEYLKRLKKAGIDCSLVTKHADDVTPTAIIGTDTGERQITFFHPGADRMTDAPDVKALKNKVALAIISPHSAFSMERTAQACIQAGIPFIFDPGQQCLQFGVEEFQRILTGSAGMIVNAYEWSLIAEQHHWSMDEVLGLTEWLIVTHGEHGIGIQTREESVVVEAVPTAKLVNPTGAGDAFRAGLLSGLGADMHIRDAARIGAALASLCVEHEVTQMEEFDLEEMWKRAEEAYGEMQKL